MTTTLLLGDCLKLMQDIPDKSIDMILCDLPYGTTDIKWDKVIPFEPMWKQYERVIKDNGAIVLFSAQPFTTDLIVSNRRLFRYEIIWKKTCAQGFLNANKAPLRGHENILVFYKKSPTYNPIKSRIQNEKIGKTRPNNPMRSQQYRIMDRTEYKETNERYPTDVIEFSNWNGGGFVTGGKGATKHPTQKPIDLCKYLVLTYTNPGDVVLDNCFGSGTTPVACIETGRNFIGMELNPDYFLIAESRVKTAQMQPSLLLEDASSSTSDGASTHQSEF